MKAWGINGWVGMEEPEQAYFRADAIEAINSEPYDEAWRCIISLRSGATFTALKGAKAECDAAVLSIYVAMREASNG